MRICAPVWRWREKVFRLLHMPYPTNVKISDLLAAMIEGNGVPVAVKLCKCNTSILRSVSSLRCCVVLHGQRTLFEGSPCQRLQEIWLDHHLWRGFEGQRPRIMLGLKVLARAERRLTSRARSVTAWLLASVLARA